MKKKTPRAGNSQDIIKVENEKKEFSIYEDFDGFGKWLAL